MAAAVCLSFFAVERDCKRKFFFALKPFAGDYLKSMPLL